MPTSDHETQTQSNPTLLKYVPKRWRKVSKPVLKAVAFGAAVVAFATNVEKIVTFSGDRISDLQMHWAKGKIMTPSSSQPVKATVDFKGTINHRPKGSSLWLVIYASGIKKYYPYEIIRHQQGETWELPSVEIGLPTDFKRTFQAELYLLDDTQTEQFRRQTNRLMRMTTHKRISDRGLQEQPQGKLLQSVELKRSDR